MRCQYLVIEEDGCDLKGEGGICWKAKGGKTPEEKDCWVPNNKGVMKAL